MTVHLLGEYQGVYEPGYQVDCWKNGNPHLRLRSDKVNWDSIVAIQTSKSVSDIAGTFTISLKDRRARSTVAEMDVVRIRLRGHGEPLVTTFRGVVDEVRQGGSADTYAGSEDTVVTGRCMAKYLQVCSLFRPVWDVEGLLPTATIFGLGDVTQKVGNSRTVGSNSPRAIYGYLLRNFVYGRRGVVGIGGIPNSRFWLNYKTRFQKDLGFQIPFIQFDEDDMATALKRLEVLGFTEAWVDELGHIVYRRPQWDAPASFQLNTDDMKNWNFSKSDLDMKTYVEVVPGGNPGIDTGLAQALMSGRAPVPFSYIATTGDKEGLGAYVSAEFVIDTDVDGKVTAKGRLNPWYKRQRRYGVRPYQVVSPLIFSQPQAQAQAEGLLRFYSRHLKTGSVTIPGAPSVKVGTTLRLHGLLDGLKTDRTYYIEGCQHEYVEGSHYDTTLVLTHGRDPHDPDWSKMTLPKADPKDIVNSPGVLDPTSGNTSGDVPSSVNSPDGSPAHVINTIILPLGREIGATASGGGPLTVANVDAANARHSLYVAGTTRRSEHKGPPDVCWAVDLAIGTDTARGDKMWAAVMRRLGHPELHSGAWQNVVYDGYVFNCGWRVPGHFDHVHVGCHRA